MSAIAKMLLASFENWGLTPEGMLRETAYRRSNEINSDFILDEIEAYVKERM